MRVAQFSEPNAPLQVVERNVPDPRPGTVRIKVEACGVCHSDSVVASGGLPGIEYPRVPGHEVLGVIDAVGAGVASWKSGQRVGVGWNGGYDGTCDACRRGEFFSCITGQVTGATFDGGYAEYMIAPTSALARAPAEFTATEAAPLLCAGVTTFNSLRRSGATAGDTVAILGIGGLGHLAVQYAAKMGFRTVAIARGRDKEAFARKLGAVYYIDGAASNVAAELTKLGGASVILATATSSKAMSDAIGGLGPNGKLIVIGVGPEPIQAPPYLLISGNRSIAGWYSGVAIDSQDTLAFSLLSGVRPMVEVFPLEQAPQAFARMMSGAARFRVVLSMTNS